MCKEFEPQDIEQTEAQLLQEITALRQRVAQLEGMQSRQQSEHSHQLTPHHQSPHQQPLHQPPSHEQSNLQTHRQRLDLVLRTSDIGIWFCDLPSFQWEWDDKCREHFGLPPHTNITVKQFFKQLHPTDRRWIWRAVRRAIQERTVYDVTCRLTAPNGKLCWIRVIGSIFYDTTGQPKYFDGITVNVTEQKHQEEERDSLLYREQLARETAEAANRVKDEFLGVLSHELRSPLNPILGWSRLLQKRAFDPAIVKRALQAIERNAKLQAQLIEDLLDISQILRGKLMLNTCTVDLAEVITETLETVHLAAEAKSIKIHTYFEPTVGKIAGDRVRLQQIIWNLLSNAIKFTPAEGWVEIKLETMKGEDGKQDESWKIRQRGRQEIEYPEINRQPIDRQPQYSQLEYRQAPLLPAALCVLPADCAKITISDTGRGISPEFLPCVFDYFRQANSTTTRKFGGLGLGLAIVRHLVELHGGTIHAASPGIGQGATFTVFLPLLKDIDRRMPDQLDSSSIQPPLQEVQSSTTLLSHPLRGTRILIVDHQLDTREIATFVLRQFGAETIVARSTNEALRVVIRERPDVLIIDLGVSDIDGYQLMRQIRTLSPQQGGQIPAIALTSYAGEYNQQRTLEAGFQLHLSKSVEPETLVAAIARLLKISFSGQMESGK